MTMPATQFFAMYEQALCLESQERIEETHIARVPSHDHDGYKTILEYFQGQNPVTRQAQLEFAEKQKAEAKKADPHAARYAMMAAFSAGHGHKVH